MFLTVPRTGVRDSAGRQAGSPRASWNPVKSQSQLEDLWERQPCWRIQITTSMIRRTLTSIGTSAAVRQSPMSASSCPALGLCAAACMKGHWLLKRRIPRPDWTNGALVPRRAVRRCPPTSHTQPGHCHRAPTRDVAVAVACRDRRGRVNAPETGECAVIQRGAVRSRVGWRRCRPMLRGCGRTAPTWPKSGAGSGGRLLGRRRCAGWRR